MNVVEYISKDINPLHPESTILDAKLLFNSLTFSHLPIVENGVLLGSISESDVRSIDNDAKKMNAFRSIYAGFMVLEVHNWMEILKVFAANETTIVPVLNKNKKYIGYYELTDILHYFNETYFLQTQGFILVVEKGLADYSMSEIAQIVESNKGKLLGLFISRIKGNTMRVTVKIASEEINEIIQTFRRYDYTVLTKHKEDFLLEDLKNRSNYLQKYLNM